MDYLTNAFSLSMLQDMLSEGNDVNLRVRRITPDKLLQLYYRAIRAQYADVPRSAIGHADTAEYVRALLLNEIAARGASAKALDLFRLHIERLVTHNREEIRLVAGDRVIVFQLLQRLEEGRILDANEIASTPYLLAEVRVEQAN